MREGQSIDLYHRQAVVPQLVEEGWVWMLLTREQKVNGFLFDRFNFISEGDGSFGDCCIRCQEQSPEKNTHTSCLCGTYILNWGDRPYISNKTQNNQLGKCCEGNIQYTVVQNGVVKFDIWAFLCSDF